MKIKILCFALIAFTTNSFAQITINSSDLPTTSGTYVRDNAGNTSIIDLNVTGPNTTWDYSGLSSNGIDTIQYMTVSSTNFAYQLYFNNPFSPDYDSDLAVDGVDFPSIPAVPITITDVVNYFKKANNDGYYQTGFGASISGLPASIKYTPRDKVLPLPCTYGLTESNLFEWNFAVPSVGTYGQRKTRTVEVDGWGTLNLPNGGTYNTLRVKSTIEGIDTVYIDQFSFGIAIPSTQLEYKWYAQGEGEPVLTVTATDLLGTSTISGVNHKHHDNTAGISSKNILNTNLDLFPNPSNTIVNIKYYTPVYGPLTIDLFDITGKKVYSTQEISLANTNNQYHINTDFIDAGLYTIQLSQEGSVSSAMISVNK
ncbi:MAG TPA: T9SS type A sorting domain-containing protein [Bacteroidia bacterium]|nr:T9SS type A sorting domain-containing protein [Bacteroidia bacterium]